MESPHKPGQSGVFCTRSAYSSGDRARRLPFPKPWPESVSALAGAYEFFTPAVLHLQGRLVEAAWIDMLHQAPGMALYFAKFDQPLFSGLETADGSPDWNHVLFAVRGEYFSHVVRFLANCVIRDAVTGEVRCYFPQEVAVLDPFAMTRSRIVTSMTPKVSVASFGVTTSKWRYGISPASDLNTMKPRGARAPSRGTAAAYAAAFAAGKNPVQESVRDLWKYILKSRNLKLRNSSQTIEDAPLD